MAESSEPQRTVYLVDGTGNLYRAFHAIRELSNSRGLPTNAVYGFTMMLRKLVKAREPRYLAVAFDLAEPTFRHRAYADYKAHRPPAPESLVVQIPYVKRVCRALCVPTVELSGFEADDLIATLAERAVAAGFRVVVVASDKDLLQLVSDEVRVYNPVSDQMLDADGVESTFGVRPRQVPDVLALWGDASDNIPGVPGIGEKGAKDLVRRFGDLENVLAQADQVERKSYREGLKAHAASARACLDLVTLRRDAPVALDPEGLRLGDPDLPALRGLFEELEFTTLLSELAAPVEATPVEANPRLCEVIVDLETLRRRVAALVTGGAAGLRVERDGEQPMRADVVGVTVADAGGAAFYVPLAHRALGTPRQIPVEDALRALRPLWTTATLRRTGHDVKSDLVILSRLGEPPFDHDFDTMLASYLLDPSRHSHAIEAVAAGLSGLEAPALESVVGAGARRTALADVTVERTAPVVGARLAAVMAMKERLRADLEANGLLRLLTDLEMPLTRVLAGAESAGVRIDARFLNDLATDWDGRLKRLIADIHASAGREFNINSPRQLAEILFETLKLQPGRRTRKTRTLSTDAAVLEDLAASHELPRLVLEYRTIQKLKSGYVDALPQLIEPRTGRVHTSFNQAVAATGRLSSSDPNLQNIPIRTDLGRQIRRAFVAEDGARLLSADYSQIELRVLAHLSGDPGLVAAFNGGEDVHRRTAAEIFGAHPDLVTDTMRRRAKAINFGIIYGMGPQRLAREQGIALKEAVAFIERYFERFPKVKEYIDRTIAAVEREGRVRTLFDRVRYFPEMGGTDRNARQQAIRAAVNTTIQGTAADLIKMAMVTLARRLEGEGSGARITLQVHDELVLEVPEGYLAAVAGRLRESMETVWPLAVPLTVDLKSGPNWLDMEPIPRSKD